MASVYIHQGVLHVQWAFKISAFVSIFCFCLMYTHYLFKVLLKSFQIPNFVFRLFIPPELLYNMVHYYTALDMTQIIAQLRKVIKEYMYINGIHF